jgi:hypothetical protein
MVAWSSLMMQVQQNLTVPSRLHQPMQAVVVLEKHQARVMMPQAVRAM